MCNPRPLALLLCLAAPAHAQSTPRPCVESMPGMTMCPPSVAKPAAAPTAGMTANMAPGMQQMMQNMDPHTFLAEIEHHATSGTSAEPNSTPVPMLMAMHGPWMGMVHGNVFITDLQQSSPRGGDKLFSTNWLMPMAERRLGPGQLTLRAMFSLEPATITGRQYPLLFQQGETAFNNPIVDGQHPHNFFMELAALYDWELGPHTLLSFYAAPMGDPAIGPTAYPHRASALEDPVGSLGHHQEDSTHIANDVVTVGLTHGIARVEASGFHGREPNENRWNLQVGAVDSWSTRLTLQPTQNLSGQVSYARIASPEALFPTENQGRTTASIMYNQPFHNGNLASTVLWGRTRSLADDSKENSYLFESTLRFHTANYAYTRIENAGRSNELLNGPHPLPPGFTEQPIGHVQAYTFGYDRDLDGFLDRAHLALPHLRTALGAQFTTYGVPGVLRPIYGTDPIGIAVSVRFRPFSGEQR
ncbi:hypothetical protein [Acidipila sp. EB88]|uniref:hypothetical protein n=1 Tax=Acidipila sp. EB88 TaxID=2305226 RepID=UPI0018F28680|nr:hypothetical protein [Acidipila sp. EB88]